MAPKGLTPKRTMPNLLRDGYELVAAKLYERLCNRCGAFYVYALDSGETYLMATCERRGHRPPDECLVGTYTRKTPIEVIEGDLLERLRELSRPVAA